MNVKLGNSTINIENNIQKRGDNLMEAPVLQRVKKRHKKMIPSTIIVVVTLVVIGVSLGSMMIANDKTVYRNYETQKVLDKTNDPNVIINWDEKHIQQSMHQMTHQKVQARSKVGAVEMNDDNIKSLISIVEQSKYKHKDYYLKVLNEWSRGNFGSIRKDHNKLREMNQISNDDSKAIGKASKMEEQKFIRKTFD